jgi:hypothetical protein
LARRRLRVEDLLQRIQLSRHCVGPGGKAPPLARGAAGGCEGRRIGSCVKTKRPVREKEGKSFCL